jgi:hypothetical protein
MMTETLLHDDQASSRSDTTQAVPAANPPDAAGPAPADHERRERDREARQHLIFCALLSLAAFFLFWFSSFWLEENVATNKFGNDAHLYAPLAKGEVSDRLVRFHPLTVAIVVAGLKVLPRVEPWWISPQYLMKAIFAAIGAIGVAAALGAFTAVVQRRYVLLCGAIYMVSLGVWYYSSIEESKIVTATLSALYIAIYFHLRDRWSWRGAALLTACLFLICVNEVVAGFLVAIPFVDALVRHGWHWRHWRWVIGHALAGPAALIFMEVVINGHFVPVGGDQESASHVSMLLYYLHHNDYSVQNLTAFVLKWLLFNIVAPTPDASYGEKLEFHYGGDFVPAFETYFYTVLGACALVLLLAVVGAGLVRRKLPARSSSLFAIYVAIAAYAVVRTAFFLIYLPSEPMVNSAGSSLVHLLLILIPFTTSIVPGKTWLLAVFTGALFLANGAFIFGQ